MKPNPSETFIGPDMDAGHGSPPQNPLPKSPAPTPQAPTPKSKPANATSARAQTALRPSTSAIGTETLTSGGELPPIPDDPDDSDDLPLQSSAAPSSPQDPIETVHGAFFFVDEDNVRGNVQALAMKFTEVHPVAYSSKEGPWYMYDEAEGIWLPMELRNMRLLAGSFLKHLADEKKASAFLPKRTLGFVDSMLKYAQGCCAPMGKPPPPTARLVAIADKVLDLSGSRAVLRDFRKDDWFTSKMAVGYNPDAKCTRFLTELVQPALADSDDVSLLQRDFGRMLVRGNAAQRLSVVVGEGGSGKSVVVSIVENLLGWEKMAHLRTDQLGSRFESNSFDGKSVLVAKDVKPDYFSNSGASFVKVLTGGDRFQGEIKYGGKSDMRGGFFVIVTANSRLKVKIEGDASAWRRRILYYNFTREAPERKITNLEEVLVREEGDGIFAWLVEGYYAHRAELEEIGDFRLTSAQQQRIDNLLLESEGHAAFVRAQIAASEGDLTSDEIWERYVAYCRARGWEMLSHQKFLTELAKLMVQYFGSHRTGHVVRNGVELKGYKAVGFVEVAVK